MGKVMKIQLVISILLSQLALGVVAQDHSLQKVRQGKTIRNYIVHKPTMKKDSSYKYPVVICLHGYSDTVSSFMYMTEFNQVADTAGFIVCYPQARTNKAWNSGISSSKEYPTGKEDDTAFISAMLDSLIRHHNIDVSRIYCCGFSNGGFMTFKLACELGDRIAAIGSVGGLMAESVANQCNGARKKPLIMIYGSVDNVVPKKGGNGWMSLDQTLAYWNPNQDIPHTRQFDYVGRGRSKSDILMVMKGTLGPDPDKSLSVLFEILNGDHSWPSSQYKTEIHASVELWNFFKNFSL
jgi:polyhydroxybutyrate depolymerase